MPAQAHTNTHIPRARTHTHAHILHKHRRTNAQAHAHLLVVVCCQVCPGVVQIEGVAARQRGCHEARHTRSTGAAQLHVGAGSQVPAGRTAAGKRTDSSVAATGFPALSRAAAWRAAEGLVLLSLLLSLLHASAARAESQLCADLKQLYIRPASVGSKSSCTWSHDWNSHTQFAVKAPKYCTVLQTHTADHSLESASDSRGQRPTASDCS